MMSLALLLFGISDPDPAEIKPKQPQPTEIRQVTSAKSVVKSAKSYLKQHNITAAKDLLVVDVTTQRLYHFQNNNCLASYLISTSKFGLGEVKGTKRTPRGAHKISEKIGKNAPIGAVFKARQYLGYTWDQLVNPYSKRRRDFIVTRVLRLEGLEPGFNQGRDSLGRNIDTKDRTVYIHGTTFDWKLGQPASIGCVHMHSYDIIKLFNAVDVGATVLVI